MDDWVAWERRFNQRFQQFVEYTSYQIEKPSLINFPDESTLPTETHSPSQVGVPFDFLNIFESWQFSLKTLRRIPRYLSLMTLLTEGNQINQGHYEYWRCTGAYASIASGFRSPIQTQEQFEQSLDGVDIKPSRLPNWLTLSATQLELSDLCLIIHLGLLGLQKSRIQLQQIDFENIHSRGRVHPSLEKIVDHSFNLTTRYGFPVFEGLAGNWKQASSSSLQNKLEDWSRNTDNDITKATLIEINSSPNINIDGDSILDQLYDVSTRYLEKPWKTFGKESIFYQLNDVRGKTQHGEGSYSGPAVMIVTLSCLAFWDIVGEKQFHRLRKHFLTDIGREYDRQEHIIRNLGWMPEDFYNEFTIRRL